MHVVLAPAVLHHRWYSLQSRMSSAWDERQAAQPSPHMQQQLLQQQEGAPDGQGPLLSPPDTAQHSILGSDIIPPPVSSVDLGV
jgi:hypothetical protein